MTHPSIRALGVAVALTTATTVTALTAAPAHADRPVGAELGVVLTSGHVSPFTSVLPGCESGTVTDQGPHLKFLPTHGSFHGFKVFTCAGGAGGFTVHIEASFDGGGSWGSWAVTDSWGTQAGAHGAGTLVGIPYDGGIADHYYD
jgi:hypothetical protein